MTESPKVELGRKIVLMFTKKPVLPENVLFYSYLSA